MYDTLENYDDKYRDRTPIYLRVSLLRRVLTTCADVSLEALGVYPEL